MPRRSSVRQAIPDDLSNDQRHQLRWVPELGCYSIVFNVHHDNTENAIVRGSPVVLQLAALDGRAPFNTKQKQSRHQTLPEGWAFAQTPGATSRSTGVGSMVSGITAWPWGGEAVVFRGEEENEWPAFHSSSDQTQAVSVGEDEQGFLCSDGCVLISRWVSPVLHVFQDQSFLEQLSSSNASPNESKDLPHCRMGTQRALLIALMLGGNSSEICEAVESEATALLESHVQRNSQKTVEQLIAFLCPWLEQCMSSGFDNNGFNVPELASLRGSKIEGQDILPEFCMAPSNDKATFDQNSIGTSVAIECGLDFMYGLLDVVRIIAPQALSSVLERPLAKLSRLPARALVTNDSCSATAKFVGSTVAQLCELQAQAPSSQNVICRMMLELARTAASAVAVMAVVEALVQSSDAGTGDTSLAAGLREDVVKLCHPQTGPYGFWFVEHDRRGWTCGRSASGLSQALRYVAERPLAPGSLTAVNVRGPKFRPSPNGLFVEIVFLIKADAAVPAMLSASMLGLSSDKHGFLGIRGSGETVPGNGMRREIVHASGPINSKYIGFLIEPGMVTATLDGVVACKWHLDDDAFFDELALHISLPPRCEVSFNFDRSTLRHKPAGGEWETWLEYHKGSRACSSMDDGEATAIDVAGALSTFLLENHAEVTPGSGVVTRIWSMLAELSQSKFAGCAMGPEDSEHGLNIRQKVVLPLLQMFALHGSKFELSLDKYDSIGKELLAVACSTDTVLSRAAAKTMASFGLGRLLPSTTTVLRLLLTLPEQCPLLVFLHEDAMQRSLHDVSYQDIEDLMSHAAKGHARFTCMLTKLLVDVFAASCQGISNMFITVAGILLKGMLPLTQDSSSQLSSHVLNPLLAMLACRDPPAAAGVAELAPVLAPLHTLHRSGLSVDAFAFCGIALARIATRLCSLGAAAANGPCKALPFGQLCLTNAKTREALGDIFAIVGDVLGKSICVEHLQHRDDFVDGFLAELLEPTERTRRMYAALHEQIPPGFRMSLDFVLGAHGKRLPQTIFAVLSTRLKILNRLEHASEAMRDVPSPDSVLDFVPVWTAANKLASEFRQNCQQQQVSTDVVVDKLMLFLRMSVEEATDQDSPMVRSISSVIVAAQELTDTDSPLVKSVSCSFDMHRSMTMGLKFSSRMSRGTSSMTPKNVTRMLRRSRAGSKIENFPVDAPTSSESISEQSLSPEVRKIRSVCQPLCYSVMDLENQSADFLAGIAGFDIWRRLLETSAMANDLGHKGFNLATIFHHCTCSCRDMRDILCSTSLPCTWQRHLLSQMRAILQMSITTSDRCDSLLRLVPPILGGGEVADVAVQAMLSKGSISAVIQAALSDAPFQNEDTSRRPANVLLLALLHGTGSSGDDSVAMVQQELLQELLELLEDEGKNEDVEPMEPDVLNVNWSISASAQCMQEKEVSRPCDDRWRIKYFALEFLACIPDVVGNSQAAIDTLVNFCLRRGSSLAPFAAALLERAAERTGIGIWTLVLEQRAPELLACLGTLERLAWSKCWQLLGNPQGCLSVASSLARLLRNAAAEQALVDALAVCTHDSFPDAGLGALTVLSGASDRLASLTRVSVSHNLTDGGAIFSTTGEELVILSASSKHLIRRPVSDCKFIAPCVVAWSARLHSCLAPLLVWESEPPMTIIRERLLGSVMVIAASTGGVLTTLFEAKVLASVAKGLMQAASATPLSTEALQELELRVGQERLKSDMHSCAALIAPAATDECCDTASKSSEAQHSASIMEFGGVRIFCPNGSCFATHGINDNAGSCIVCRQEPVVNDCDEPDRWLTCKGPCRCALCPACADKRRQDEAREGFHMCVIGPAEPVQSPVSPFDFVRETTDPDAKSEEAQLPHIVTVSCHPHPLRPADASDLTFWSCDGRSPTCTRQNQQDFGTRWECRMCNYDLCQDCLDQFRTQEACFVEGSRVQGRRIGDARWHSARICSDNGDGTFLVSWDDGDHQWRIQSLADLRFIAPPDATHTQTHLPDTAAAATFRHSLRSGAGVTCETLQPENVASAAAGLRASAQASLAVVFACGPPRHALRINAESKSEQHGIIDAASIEEVREKARGDTTSVALMPGMDSVETLLMGKSSLALQALVRNFPGDLNLSVFDSYWGASEVREALLRHASYWDDVSLGRLAQAVVKHSEAMDSAWTVCAQSLIAKLCDEPVIPDKTITVQTRHDYGANEDVVFKMSCPGCRSLKIEFDRRSYTERGCDELKLFSDAARTKQIHVFSGKFPRNCTVEGDSVWGHWSTDQNHHYWGWRLVASATGTSSHQTNSALCLPVKNLQRLLLHTKVGLSDKLTHSLASLMLAAACIDCGEDAAVYLEMIRAVGPLQWNANAKALLCTLGEAAAESPTLLSAVLALRLEMLETSSKPSRFPCALELVDRTQGATVLNGGKSVANASPAPVVAHTQLLPLPIALSIQIEPETPRHGCAVELGLSGPEGPTVWLRLNSIKSPLALPGEMLSLGIGASGTVAIVGRMLSNGGGRRPVSRVVSLPICVGSSRTCRVSFRLEGSSAAAGRSVGKVSLVPQGHDGEHIYEFRSASIAVREASRAERVADLPNAFVTRAWMRYEGRGAATGAADIDVLETSAATSLKNSLAKIVESDNVGGLAVSHRHIRFPPGCRLRLQFDSRCSLPEGFGVKITADMAGSVALPDLALEAAYAQADVNPGAPLPCEVLAGGMFDLESDDIWLHYPMPREPAWLLPSHSLDAEVTQGSPCLKPGWWRWVPTCIKPSWWVTLRLHSNGGVEVCRCSFAQYIGDLGTRSVPQARRNDRGRRLENGPDMTFRWTKFSGSWSKTHVQLRLDGMEENGVSSFGFEARSVALAQTDYALSHFVQKNAMKKALAGALPELGCQGTLDYHPPGEPQEKLNISFLLPCSSDVQDRLEMPPSWHPVGEVWSFCESDAGVKRIEFRTIDGTVLKTCTLSVQQGEDSPKSSRQSSKGSRRRICMNGIDESPLSEAGSERSQTMANSRSSDDPIVPRRGSAANFAFSPMPRRALSFIDGETNTDVSHGDLPNIRDLASTDDPPPPESVIFIGLGEHLALAAEGQPAVAEIPDCRLSLRRNEQVDDVEVWGIANVTSDSEDDDDDDEDSICESSLRHLLRPRNLVHSTGNAVTMVLPGNWAGRVNSNLGRSRKPREWPVIWAQSGGGSQAQLTGLLHQEQSDEKSTETSIADALTGDLPPVLRRRSFTSKPRTQSLLSQPSFGHSMSMNAIKTQPAALAPELLTVELSDTVCGHVKATIQMAAGTFALRGTLLKMADGCGRLALFGREGDSWLYINLRSPTSISLGHSCAISEGPRLIYQPIGLPTANFDICAVRDGWWKQSSVEKGDRSETDVEVSSVNPPDQCPDSVQGVELVVDHLEGLAWLGFYESSAPEAGQADTENLPPALAGRLTLNDIAGIWRSSSGPVWAINRHGRALRNGEEPAICSDLFERDGRVERGDAQWEENPWQLDLRASNADRCVWQQPGQTDVVWSRVTDIGKYSWEIQEQNGVWQEWNEVVNFRGEPGEEIEFRRQNTVYRVRFSSASAGVQTNTRTLTQKALRRIEAIVSDLTPLRPQHIPPSNEWATFGARALEKSSGKYYYEVCFHERNMWSSSFPQIGWCSSEFEVSSNEKQVGVGDDQFGWAADGVRCIQWHDGREIRARWPRQWQTGDVIGCAIDIEAGRMYFSLCGTWVPEAEMQFDPAGRTFFPALSMRGDFSLNVRQDRCAHLPPSADYLPLANSGVFTRPSPNKASLLRWALEEDAFSPEPRFRHQSTSQVYASSRFGLHTSQQTITTGNVPNPSLWPWPLAILSWRSDGVLALGNEALPASSTLSFGAGDSIAALWSSAGSLRLILNGSVVYEGRGPCLLPNVAVGLQGGCQMRLVTAPQFPHLALEQLINVHDGVSEVLSPSESMAVERIFRALDTGSGSLKRDEFSAVLGGPRPLLFSALDTNDDGLISIEEWTSYCSAVRAARGSARFSYFLSAFEWGLARRGYHIGSDVLRSDASGHIDIIPNSDDSPQDTVAERVVQKGPIMSCPTCNSLCVGRRTCNFCEREDVLENGWRIKVVGTPMRLGDSLLAEVDTEALQSFRALLDFGRNAGSLQRHFALLARLLSEDADYNWTSVSSLLTDAALRKYFQSDLDLPASLKLRALLSRHLNGNTLAPGPAIEFAIKLGADNAEATKLASHFSLSDAGSVLTLEQVTEADAMMEQVVHTGLLEKEYIATLRNSLVAKACILAEFGYMVQRVMPALTWGRLGATQWGSDLVKAKALMTSEVKRKRFDVVMQETEYHGRYQNGYDTTVLLNKAGATKFVSLVASQKIDWHGKHTLFGQLWAKLRGWPPELFRVEEHDRPFKVIFEGMGGEDVGGLFREALNTAMGEVQSGALPLMVRTPNGADQCDEIGDNRECWLLAPCASAPHGLSMLCFLGALLGLALRCGELLALDWPIFLWKRLVGEERTVSDIRTIDVRTDILVKRLREDPCMASSLRWTYTDVAGFEMPLRAGSQGEVALDEIPAFIDAIIRSRLHYDDDAVAALRAGMAAVVPIDLLELWTPQELERAICGKRDIDVELLKVNTDYLGAENTDPIFDMFWEVFESFNNSERAQLLTFTWGRSRLPTSTHFPQRFQLYITFGSDDRLPISHTCTFQLDLPRYSSATIMAEKLRFAMFHCVAIDADGARIQGRNVDWDEDEFSSSESEELESPRFSGAPPLRQQFSSGSSSDSMWG